MANIGHRGLQSELRLLWDSLGESRMDPGDKLKQTQGTQNFLVTTSLSCTIIFLPQTSY